MILRSRFIIALADMLEDVTATEHHVGGAGFKLSVVFLVALDIFRFLVVELIEADLLLLKLVKHEALVSLLHSHFHLLLEVEEHLLLWLERGGVDVVQGLAFVLL